MRKEKEKEKETQPRSVSIINVVEKQPDEKEYNLWKQKILLIIGVFFLGFFMDENALQKHYWIFAEYGRPAQSCEFVFETGYG